MRLTYELTGDKINTGSSPVYNKIWRLTGLNLETASEMASLIKEAVINSVSNVLEKQMENTFEVDNESKIQSS